MISALLLESHSDAISSKLPYWHDSILQFLRYRTNQAPRHTIHSCFGRINKHGQYLRLFEQDLVLQSNTSSPQHPPGDPSPIDGVLVGFAGERLVAGILFLRSLREWLNHHHDTNIPTKCVSNHITTMIPNVPPSAGAMKSPPWYQPFLQTPSAPLSSTIS